MNHLHVDNEAIRRSNLAQRDETRKKWRIEMNEHLIELAAVISEYTVLLNRVFAAGRFLVLLGSSCITSAMRENFLHYRFETD